MKILVVDDSIVFRTSITQALSAVPGFDVFKSVVNGKLALDILKLHPDTALVTLDMEMPVMDGIQTIKEIRKFNQDVTIIVFSSLTVTGAEKTIEALSAGADDFVTKSEGTGGFEESLEQIRVDLIPRIQAISERKLKRSSIESRIKSAVVSEKTNTVAANEMQVKPKLIVIGSSTGGPEALASIFKNITEKVSVPMLLVQHMPPIFTEKLAVMLSKLSPVEVKEAKHGDLLQPGVCYIAPGDYHMTVNKLGQIHLNQEQKVCFVRPSVDVLLNSLAENFEKQILSIILTGMGEDGALGAKKLLQKGAYIYIQDKESSIVWGMPGAVFRAIGDKAKIVDLSLIGNLINTVSKRI